MKSNVFRADDLVLCYAPANLRSVMPGNKVMLRSGGHEMIVCGVDVDGRAVCQWLDDDGEMQSSAFLLECLTCFGAQ